MNIWDNFSNVTELDFLEMKELFINVGSPEYATGHKATMDERMSMLEVEFSHQSILLFYHTWLIVNIRRQINIETYYDAHKKLWEKESDYLIKYLSTRWLVSACDTFIDCSNNSIEVALSTSVVLLINTIKLYETEELMIFNEFGITYSKNVPDRRIPIFDGMSTFRIGRGDMIHNMMKRITRQKYTNSVAYLILLEIITRINTYDTVYKRMSQRYKKSWWKNGKLNI